MGHANTPPQLPEVTDEAGDSPKWIPWLGAAVFVLGAAWVGLCHVSCSAEGGADSAAESAQ